MAPRSFLLWALESQLLYIKVTLTLKFILMTKPPTSISSFPLFPTPPFLLLSARRGEYLYALLVPNQPSDGEILRLLCSKRLKKVATKNPRQEEVSPCSGVIRFLRSNKEQLGDVLLKVSRVPGLEEMSEIQRFQ